MSVLLGILEVDLKSSNNLMSFSPRQTAPTPPHSQPTTVLKPTLPSTLSSPSTSVISPFSAAPIPKRTAGITSTANTPPMGTLSRPWASQLPFALKPTFSVSPALPRIPAEPSSVCRL